MKIICVMVMSLDGKTTKGTSNRLPEWTSREDQAHFAKIIAENNCIIMGSKTYLAAKPMMKHSPSKLRIIMTGHPEKFADQAIREQLEFTHDQPKEILNKLAKKGYQQVILAGGANTNRLFFQQNLVDELWVTIEPKLFGAGNSVIGDQTVDIELQLEHMEKINNLGTLLLKYKITD